MNQLFCSLIVVAAAFLATLSARASAPAWLRTDAQLAPLPAALAFQGEAEVLRDEVVIVVDAQGEWTETWRYAVRVRSISGIRAAQMKIQYAEKTDKIISATAWLLHGNNRPKTYPQRRWVDLAAMNQTTLYTDFRALINIDGPREATVGDTYGGEAVVRRGNVPGQDRFSWGDRYPLRRGRIEFRLPPGWEPDLLWMRGTAPAAHISADRTNWAWEISDVPAVKEEPWAPEDTAPYLAAVTVRPPAGAATRLPKLQTWNDYARWNASIVQSRCDTSPALREKVAALTTGLTDPWQKLEALTQFAQKQTYIQQYYNTGLGFGYRPRLASEVFATGYGDCKDKANLLQALLGEAGFRSHFTILRVQPGTAIKPEWAGPQFNHAIVAIELPPGVESPTAITHPVFGRLLFFDPTHPWVPLGQLPWQEYGTLGLICENQETALTPFPLASPESAWSSTSQVELAFGDRGVLRGRLTEITNGEPAAKARAQAHEASPADKRHYWTDRLVRGIRGVKVADPVEQELPDGRRSVEVSFAAKEFGQLVQDKFLLLRLNVLNRNTVPAFPAPHRLQPVVLRPVHEVEAVRVALPDRCTVPELPPTQSLRGEFGQYEGTYAMTDGWLVYHRTFTLQAGTIPPEKYAALRDFLGSVAQAEATTVAVRLPTASSAPSAPSSLSQ